MQVNRLMDANQLHSYEQVNDRLKEIVDLVSDEGIALDDALDLFEEAVKLGVQASSLLEEDIAARNNEESAQPACEPGAGAGTASE